MRCISGGDDYQLLFTATASQREQISQLSTTYPGLSRIGQVVKPVTGQPVRLWMHSEEVTLAQHTGYQHF